MNKISLLKDTILYTIMFFGQKAAALIVAPLMIHFFSAAEYGFFTLINLVGTFVYILGMMGIADQGLPRFFTESKDATEKKEYVRAAVLITVLANVIVILLYSVISPYLAKVFGITRTPLMFFILVTAWSVSQTVFYMGNSLLRWTLQSSRVLRISLFKNISATLLIALGISFLAWQSQEIIFVMALTTLLSGLWANYSAREYLQSGEISLHKIKKLLSFSFPLLGLNIFAFCSVTLNSFLLAHLTSLNNLGVFAVANIIANVFEAVTSGFFWASGPYMLLTYKETWAPKKYAELFNLVALIGIVCIIVLGLWGEPVVKLVKPDATYQNIGILIPWILGGTVFYYLGAYFSPGPYLFHKTHLNLIVFLIAAISNLVLSYVLIPRIGIIGAGISVTSSSLLSAVLLQTISNKLFFIPNPWKKTFLVILITIILVSCQQTDILLYNINSFSLGGRAIITVILLILALLPFSQEIRALNLKQQLHHYGRKLFLPKTQL